MSWAILNGDKRVENRHFRMQPGWYALHTGAKTSSDASQLPLIAGVKGMPNEADLPHSAIIVKRVLCRVRMGAAMRIWSNKAVLASKRKERARASDGIRPILLADVPHGC